ncbi:DedA family protein [Nocardioides sp. BGMRC 2183]|nr:DedA family protein [Nocardioides sp. BGMRC 2183]
MAVVVMFVLIVLDGVVPLVPGEATLLALAPAAVAVGWPAVLGLGILAAAAAALGDTITYRLGRRVGTSRFRWMRRARIAHVLTRTGDALERNGIGVITTARLMPGWRVAVTFMAGATGMSPRRFHLASALGAMLWAAYLFCVGTMVGAVTGGNALVVAVISMVTIAVISQSVTWVGRRFRMVPALMRCSAGLRTRAAAVVLGSPRHALAVVP